ncbi:MAG: hypothetical protein ACSHX6_07075 [Akkermansiaceae bacterium]
MKNDIKKYLTLGAALAGSAFMVSCDGDDVTVTETTFDTSELVASINDLGTKPVAPIKLAEYPLTSLKLTFEALAGGCVGTTFNAGDELEIDFDSINVLSADATTASHAQADLAPDGFVIFGLATQEGYVEGLENLTDTFTIDSVKAGVDTTGSTLLSNLTFTPFASDLRSVSGRFIGSATVEVAFNQDTDNVVVDLEGLIGNTLATSGGAATVNSVTIYEDVAGAPVEVESLDASVTHESLLGSTNYGVSVSITFEGVSCVVNFAIGQAQADALETIDGDAASYVAANIQALLDVLDVETTLDVSDETPIVNEIGASTSPVHLIEGATDGGVEGSYRHDFDSSQGTLETIIDSDSDDTF